MFHLLIVIAVALVLVGALVWIVKQLPGVSEEFKGLFTKIAVVVAAICLLFYLLNAFGLLGGGDIPVPQLR